MVDFHLKSTLAAVSLWTFVQGRESDCWFCVSLAVLWGCNLPTPNDETSVTLCMLSLPSGDLDERPLKVKVLLTVAYPMIYLYHLMPVPLCSPSAVTAGYRCLIGWLGIVLRRRTDGGERNWHAAIRPAVEGCDWLVRKQRNIFCSKTCNSGTQQVEKRIT